MLKIKDNIKLEELEKYGFETKKGCYGFNDYFRFTRPNENYFLVVDPRDRKIYCYKGKVYCQVEAFAYCPFEKLEIKDEYIEKLIQDGLVEKVEG